MCCNPTLLFLAFWIDVYFIALFRKSGVDPEPVVGVRGGQSSVLTGWTQAEPVSVQGNTSNRSKALCISVSEGIVEPIHT